MADCILSSQNRFYVGLESSYGQTPSVGPDERISAVRLAVRQRRVAPDRRDKTGSRTFTGVVPGARRETDFELETYLTNNPSPAAPPAIGALVESALGGTPLVFAGGTAGTGSSASQIVFSGAHGLVVGQAFTHGGELRFVEQVDSATQVTVNAPFSVAPSSGAALGPAVSYMPADTLPSASIFDYWDPATAVQRIVHGGSVEQFRVRVNADFHQLEFAGPAQDVIDSVSFVSGQAGLTTYPGEPAVNGATEPPVPGNLGQAWLGSTASRFHTLTSAVVEVDNDLDLRRREFGTTTPQCVAPGVRRVTADLEMFEVDDDATRGLYAAARSETPIQVMFQLGQAAGQVLGVYLPAVVPEVPELDDGERILQWRFREGRAQGTVNDEIVVAFG